MKGISRASSAHIAATGAASTITGVINSGTGTVPLASEHAQNSDFVQGLPRLLTTEQVAHVLGKSPRVVFAMVFRNELSVVRIGRSLRYKASYIRSYINSRESAETSMRRSS